MSCIGYSTDSLVHGNNCCTEESCVVALPVFEFRRLLYVCSVKATQHVPDSQHSRWRHNSSVPGCHRLCSCIYSLAAETERNSCQVQLVSLLQFKYGDLS